MSALANRALAPRYDVIVCGAGSSGSVLARRLSDDPAVQVLLLEAGGDDQRPEIIDPARWAENIGSETDWGYTAEPSPLVDGRAVGMSMGKVLGGGSSINVMLWARGHQRDWDQYAAVTGDPRWGYESVLSIYRRIERFMGHPDPRRGTDGLLTVTQPADPSPVASGLVEAARLHGIPVFDSPNGAMMEARSGAALCDLRIEAGKRLSVFGAYVRPVLDRPNLTVLTGAHVQRIVFTGKRASGVEVLWNGDRHHVAAARQIVVSTGAINTPKLLMLSGIGDRATLDRFGIETVAHLPGVGLGLQDHTNFPVVWGHGAEILPRGNGSEATVYAVSDARLPAPDILFCQAEFPFCSPEIAARGVPAHGWSLVGSLSQPKSRGRVRLRSADPADRPAIELNALSDPDDMRVARTVIELSLSLGAAAPFRRLGIGDPFAQVRDMGVDAFIRASAGPFFHQSCTAQMGQGDLAVVDAELKVRGVDGLTIADASVLPAIPSGNTMAPCVVIGERAADILSGAL